MLFGLPASPAGWGLMILSLRMIRVDSLKLDKRLYQRGKQGRHRLQQASVASLLSSLIFDFLSLFLAFNTTIGGIGGIMLGLLLLGPLFGPPDTKLDAGIGYNRLLTDGKRLSTTSSLHGNGHTPVRAKSHRRSWSTELKNLLTRRSSLERIEGGTTNDKMILKERSAMPGHFESPQIDSLGIHLDTEIAASERTVTDDTPIESSPDTLVDPDTESAFPDPPRPQSRMSRYAPPQNYKSRFGDFLDFDPIISRSSSPEPFPDVDPDEYAQYSFDHKSPCPLDPRAVVEFEFLELQVDDWIQLIDGQQGVVRFLGSRLSSATEWIGLEIIPDIFINGALCADWPSDGGIFVRPSAVERILHRPPLSSVVDRPLIRDWEERVQREMEASFREARQSTQSIQTLRTLASIAEDPEDETDHETEIEESATEDTESHADERDDDDDDDDDERPAPLFSPRQQSKSQFGIITTTHDVSANDTDDEDLPDHVDVPSPVSTASSKTEDNIINFEFGHFSQRNSSETELADDDARFRCSMCLGDTDEFEARMDMLVNGLDDMLAGANGQWGEERLSAEAPVVREAEFRDGVVELDGLSGKLRKRLSKWINRPVSYVGGVDLDVSRNTSVGIAE